MDYNHQQYQQVYEYPPAEMRQEDTDAEQEPIYVMTVELEEGKPQTIKIYADSTPEELAFEFCKKNDLNVGSMNYLAGQIKSLLEELNDNLQGNNKNYAGNVADCIQEEDEEYDQTETRKTNNKSNRNSHIFVNKSQESDGLNSVKQVKHVSNSSSNKKQPSTLHQHNVSTGELKQQQNIQNSKRHISGSSSNITPLIYSEDENWERGDTLHNKLAATHNQIQNQIEQSNKNVNAILNENFRNEENEILNTKELMSDNHEEVLLDSVFHSKSKSLKSLDSKNNLQINELRNNLKESKNGSGQESGSNNKTLKTTKSQNLFSYQMLYDNLKKKSSQYGNGSINSNPHMNNSKMNPTPKHISKAKSEKSNAIFERLYKNAEYKRYGAFGDRPLNSSKMQNTNLSNIDLRNNKQNPNPNNLSSITGGVNNNLNNSNIINNPLQETLNSYKKKDGAVLNTSADYSNPNRSRLQFRNGEVINYGERLYQKGMKLKEETMKKCENYKKEREEYLSNIYTYKPQVNEASAEVIRKRQEALAYDKEEFILNYNLYVDEKLERLRKKHDPNVEYSFSPKLNKNSEKIANDKLYAKMVSRLSSSQSPDPHKLRIEDLYDNFKLKQFKINELSKKVYSDFNYTPVVNQNNKFDSEILGMKFYDRQEALRQKSEEKKRALSNNITAPIDNKTGQSFFVPRILSKSRERTLYEDSKNNSMQSRTHTSGIFQYLYSYANKYNKNKFDRQKDLDTTIKKFSQSVHTTNDSEFIYSKKKEEVFKSIFRLIDSDQDNSISSLNVDLKKLPQNLNNILKPIFDELKEENETLNENEFVRACEHLYEVRVIFYKISKLFFLKF
jgi:hypothetical protein